MGREDMNKASLNNYFSKSFAAKGSRAIGWYQMGKTISREKIYDRRSKKIFIYLKVWSKNYAIKRNSTF